MNEGLTGVERVYHQRVHHLSRCWLEGRRQTNPNRTREAWRDVGVAVRVDEVCRVEQVFHIHLQAKLWREPKKPAASTRV